MLGELILCEVSKSELTKSQLAESQLVEWADSPNPNCRILPNTKGIAVTAWLKASHCELRSKVAGSISSHASNFSTPVCNKNQQGADNQGNNNLQLL